MNARTVPLDPAPSVSADIVSRSEPVFAAVICGSRPRVYLVVFGRKRLEAHGEVMADLPGGADPPPGCHVGDRSDMRATAQAAFIRSATRGRHSIRVVFFFFFKYIIYTV